MIVQKIEQIVLRGITWGHSRGYTPLMAGAQRFLECNPQVQLNWEKRSLQNFADFPIEQLAHDFDLLVIDHPWVGCAAALGNAVLPLEPYFGAHFWQDQAAHSVGRSHDSYHYNGHQWAIAIDAATPVASYRADLFERQHVELPRTWDDVVALADKGRVAVPGIPIDLLMNFYTFCLAHGQEPFTAPDTVVNLETGRKALETMRELWSRIDPLFFEANPISVAELMTKGDQYWYCPLAYGYCNYARVGYARCRLTFDEVVAFGHDGPLRTTLGGTGLAVSAYTKHSEWALRFAQWIASPVTQTTFYLEHGGQPAHRKAWTDENANRLTNGFFARTLPTLERAYLRPRHDGYLHFQDRAGLPIQQYLRSGGSPDRTLETINKLYRQHSNTSA